MNILMIGGSHGIGFDYYKKMKNKGDNVRVLSREQLEVNDEDWTQFDILNVLHEDKTFPEAGELFDDGQIDALIYCPGTIKLTPIKTIKRSDIIADLDVNLIGAFETIRNYQTVLSKSENASISLFSSVVVQNGMNFHSLVGMSKGAIEGLVRNLAAELAPKIRVNALALSLVDTPLAERLTSNEKVLEKTKEKHPLNRIGSSGDVSDMLQVLTHFSPWMTGQVITYDGGLSSIR